MIPFAIPFVLGVASTAAVLWVAGAISDGIYQFRRITKDWTRE